MIGVDLAIHMLIGVPKSMAREYGDLNSHEFSYTIIYAACLPFWLGWAGGSGSGSGF
jgi:hypothetical protein